MRKITFFRRLIALIGMVILIIDGKAALEGSKEGIEICIEAVIPSLFPFIFLSALLTSGISQNSARRHSTLLRYLRVPIGGEALLICAFLGGYPSGAQAVYRYYKQGNIGMEDASKLIGLYNNAGPAFIFGMLSSVFSKGILWLLWFIHIVSSVFVRLFSENVDSCYVADENNQNPSISEILISSIRAMASVCGWVILFRIIITFADRWILWAFPNQAKSIILGIMELTNGCLSLISVSDIKQRFCICSIILAFGGLCVTLQTISICRGFPIKYYLRTKFLHALISMVLSIFIMYKLWIPLLITFFLSIIYIAIKKNKDSIFHPVHI